jgi:hypothetical protein
MGMVWMVVMKMCAAIIIWTTIIVVQLLVVALTYLLYTMGTARKTEIEAYPEGVEKPYNYTLYVSYGAMVVCGIMFCAIVCMYNKIRIVIKIMETSADFVTEVCTVMLVPPIMMLLTIVWSLVWIYLAVYVYSNGEIAQAKPAKGELYGKPYGNVTWTDEVRKQFYAFVFGFIWICCFFDAMNQFLIASTACIWYFSPRDPNSINDKMVTKAVTRSVFRCLCYHIGTLAFGSFLVAVVKSMQLVLRYVEK